MTQRSWIDAMRCLVYENAAAVDRAAARADRRRAATLGGDRRPADPAVEGPVHRRRQRDDVARAAGPRRHGLRRGDRRRAALPRHPHRRHLRGHQRDPGRRPRRAQAVDARRWGRERAARRVRRSTPTALAELAELRNSASNLHVAVGTARTATEHLAERATTDPNALLVGVDAVPAVARHRRVRRLAGQGVRWRPTTANDADERRSITPRWCRRGSSASRSCPPRSAS